MYNPVIIIIFFTLGKVSNIPPDIREQQIAVKETPFAPPI